MEQGVVLNITFMGLKMKISSIFYDVDTGDIGYTLGIQSLTETEVFWFHGTEKYLAFRFGDGLHPNRSSFDRQGEPGCVEIVKLVGPLTFKRLASCFAAVISPMMDPSIIIYLISSWVFYGLN